MFQFSGCAQSLVLCSGRLRKPASSHHNILSVSKDLAISEFDLSDSFFPLPPNNPICSGMGWWVKAKLNFRVVGERRRAAVAAEMC